MGAGSLFGESEILLGTIRESQATARTPLWVYALGCEILLHQVEQDASYSLWLTGQMSLRQERIENRLESLLFKSANGKVAQVLLALAREHGQDLDEGLLINYPITHQEIGNLITEITPEIMC